MDWLQIIVLSLIQGITEFLPISSSAHLILPAQLTSWPDQGLAFDVAVHAGTLLAVCAYFRTELGGYVSGSLTAVSARAMNEQFDMLLKLMVATIPLVIGGLLLRHWVAESLRSTLVIAITTISFALLLALADRRRADISNVSWTAAVIVGCSQILALVPGTSRSGVTITFALLLGLSRSAAARFSFLLAIPAILGAALLTGADLFSQPEPVMWSDLTVGFALAGASAFVCIGTFMRLVERTGMWPYVWYRLLLGALLLWLTFGG